MTNPRLAVSASVVRYLLALDALKSSGGIRTIDVARHLNVKKPSAHTMLNNLRDAGILTPSPRLLRVLCRPRQTLKMQPAPLWPSFQSRCSRSFAHKAARKDMR